MASGHLCALALTTNNACVHLPQASPRYGLGATQRMAVMNKPAAALVATASRLSGVEMAPPDPILGVSEAFKASKDPTS
ncbi:hypothetical protein COO60DRAFT_128327 [Scenedesmus sp. NREL 46B-D3]|nr:hypothetical protein COO60DRAFT_128327 [Scenedesmus sp. NREL 46B-D3]